MPGTMEFTLSRMTFKLSLGSCGNDLKKDLSTLFLKDLYRNRTGDTICVFVSYDPDGEIKPDVLEYIKALRNLKIDLVFVSASNCSIKEFDKISQYCRLIISRRNVGYDFYSWKIGLSHITDLLEYKKLLLVNDSVIGPFFPLDRIIEKMDSDSDAAWGLTDSYERDTHHLQSYFLYFDREIFSQPFFRKFWSRVQVISVKTKIIDEYELGLSSAIVKAGFSIKPVFPYLKLKERAKQKGITFFRDVNPSLIMWDILIQDFDFPFIKKQLFRKNPKIPASLGWEKLVQNGDKQVLDAAFLFEKSACAI